MNKENTFRNITINDIHIVNCIVNTIEKNYLNHKIINILEIGCGSGTFLIFMMEELLKKFPETEFNFHAFDIQESELTFTKKGTENIHLMNLHRVLKKKYNNINWEEKIRLIKDTDNWHSEINFFDIVISNQVLEHVNNKRLFFQKLELCLKENGNSFHVAPMSSCVLEWHIHVPFAHWFKSKKTLKMYLIIYKLFTCPIKFLKDRKSMISYINDRVKYLFEKTHYNSTAEIIEYCNNHNLKVNFTYTYPYYLLRLCRLFNIDLDKFNFYKSSSVLHHMTFYISERIACITLHVTKSTK